MVPGVEPVSVTNLSWLNDVCKGSTAQFLRPGVAVDGCDGEPEARHIANSTVRPIQLLITVRWPGVSRWLSMRGYIEPRKFESGAHARPGIRLLRRLGVVGRPNSPTGPRGAEPRRIVRRDHVRHVRWRKSLTTRQDQSENRASQAPVSSCCHVGPASARDRGFRLEHRSHARSCSGLRGLRLASDGIGRIHALKMRFGPADREQERKFRPALEA